MHQRYAAMQLPLLKSSLVDLIRESMMPRLNEIRPLLNLAAPWTAGTSPAVTLPGSERALPGPVASETRDTP